MSDHLRFIGPEEAESLSDFARPIWSNTFDVMIGKDQADTIFNTWLSPSAIRGMLSDGYELAYVEEDGEDAGFTAFHLEDPDTVYVSKLYLRPEFQGRGLGVRTLSEIGDIAGRKGAKRLRLHVNAANKKAIRVYEKYGFRVVGYDYAPIAGGYARDDIEFVLDLRLFPLGRSRAHD